MATYYFSPAGNDTTGAGTEGNPWQTISKAVTSSASGDTLLADSDNGDHVWLVRDWTSPRTLSSYGSGMAVLDGAGAAFTWFFKVDMVFSNIHFKDAVGDYGESIFARPNNFVCSASFTSCTFDNLTTPGTSNSHGIFGNVDAGVWTLNFDSCLFWDVGATTLNGKPGIISDRVGPIVSSLYNCTVYSNIADANTTFIFSVSDATNTTVHLVNNIIYNANGTNKAFFQSGTAPNTVTGSNNDILGYSSTPSLANQISADPLFVNAALGNFNLRPSSPAIDAGVFV